MEGSAYLRDIGNYEVLAGYYDELLGDDDGFAAWMPYLQEKELGSVLELASGSGLLAAQLEQQGVPVVASDLSPAMKEAARRNGFKGEYRQIDMSDPHIAGEFDTVICFCDSINYLEKEEFALLAKEVYRVLRPGGRFLFDMHAEDRLQEFQEEYIEEGTLQDGTAYQWSILADSYNRTLHENFIFFTKDGIVREQHQQNVFRLPEILVLCQEAGFCVRHEAFLPGEKELLIGEKTMIGIIAAMELEAEALKRIMEDAHEETIDNSRYLFGRSAGRDCVTVLAGIGKVAAAYNTTRLIEKFSPELLLNVGVAGSLQEDIRVGHMVVASEVAQHDLTVPGWPKGFGQAKTSRKTDEKAYQAAQSCAYPFPVHFGPMVSGDLFVMKEDALRILQDYPEALCAEMEAGAVCQCAALAGIPCLILRAISDVTVTEGNDMQFEEFALLAAEHSASFTRYFLEEYR